MLDEPRDRAARPGILAEGRELVVVDAPERDGIGLHREAGGHRRIDPGEDARELAAAGQRREPLGVERVEGDVDRREPGGHERAGEALEEMTVRGHHHLLDARDLAHPPDQVDDALADGGLAAGQADLPHAEPGEHRDHPLELLEREHRRPGGEREALAEVLRHAIGAAVVAAVGDRDAQVPDSPGKPVE